MNDLTDFYSAWRMSKKTKKSANYKRSMAILDERGIIYTKLSSDHIRAGDYDYWPSTGLFIHRESGKRGRGVFNLLRKITGKEF